jgi:DtxR family Mn-dependent transcriptional regulator
MQTFDITATHQDYLKAIYLLESQGREATNSALAQYLGVAPGSATSMVKRLAEMGFIEYEPYRCARLTDRGEQIALEMVRHHRLIEQFLHEILEMPWHKVHAEAEKLEHVISEELEEAIARKLGYPGFDPHGDPIPDRSGVKTAVSDTPLSALEVGQQARLVRVRAQDSQRLQYLGDLGLFPGALVAVLERAPFDGPLMVRVNGEEHVLAHEMAQMLYVKEV